MATVPPCILFLFLVARTSIGIAKAQFYCESISCGKGGVSIEFPFYLKESQIPGCGYPGFELSCANTTTEPLLTLPAEPGHFTVKLISLEDQQVWINDPQECLPKRLMRDRGLNLQRSPFQLSSAYSHVNYTFLRCPSNLTALSMVQPIPCLNSGFNSSSKSSVVAILSNPPFPTPWTSPCHVISWAMIPVAGFPWLFWTDYYSDIKLEWDNPNCGSCEARGGRCGFVGPTLRDTAFHVGCYDLPTQLQGLSRKTKYGLGMGLGIPGALCIIALAYLFYAKMKTHEQQRLSRSDFSTIILPRLPAQIMGLDAASIEKYPKTLLGESGRLPKPNDNLCSICLCEYQPKETLRTIPECNHYFHANCIDGWLKMNATCPLCRNLPERSVASLTPSIPASPTY
ncbi:putative RING-H2 finger protein ATL21A [Arachis hypogaea]|uniref:RING-type E3 ubiquitin transferase n=1 Tax=Arachis hypogaea TaxID=3818 RepID=A0A445DUE8_ARAHY|nr:putative RING-H2 finger protein ATL21A [Arachis hypogaea]QHO57961.1 Putative RING-H2 finger proteinA [Arachis hypogaea]RYR66796.1 hypothetical protein Ahy_A03g012865 [Arachis hypogaea]